MSIVVKNNIHWVGQRDWEVRDFHGTEYVRCAAAATIATSSAKKKRADRHRRP